MPTTTESSNGKLLIIIPGLTGHTQDNYVVSTAAALMPNYSQVCVYQYALVSEAQKCGRVDIMENLKFVINDVSTKYPIIHCVGFSYGANQLLYYVGSEGVNSKVQRAVVVSNPLQHYEVFRDVKFLWELGTHKNPKSFDWAHKQ